MPPNRAIVGRFVHRTLASQSEKPHEANQ